jgi:nitroreductase
MTDTMNSIHQRRSIRAYTPEMPPRELILECLEAASWAPNPTSQQPWQFIVLTGEPLKAVCRTIRENFAAAAAAAPGPVLPISTETQEALARRKQENFSRMLAFLKEHDCNMQAAAEGNFTFHGAPVGIMFGVYPCKDQNYLKSTIAAMQNFMLAAWSCGLGTCWMNAVSICQEHIKRELRLAGELILVDGIAVGYPAPDSPLNRIPRERLPIGEVTQWLGS